MAKERNQGEDGKHRYNQKEIKDNNVRNATYYI